MTEHRSELRTEKTTTEARAGVTGHNVRYVLAVSLAGVIIFFGGLLYLWSAWLWSELLRLSSLDTTICARGAQPEANMGRFIRRRNVERYWRLLNSAVNESDRQTMLKLLCEERQKQKDARDVFIR
jgi:hypothetical protein